MLKNYYQIKIVNNEGVTQTHFMSGWNTGDALDRVQKMVGIKKLMICEKIA